MQPHEELYNRYYKQTERRGVEVSLYMDKKRERILKSVDIENEMERNIHVRKVDIRTVFDEDLDKLNSAFTCGLC
jgi:hypothetical protein